MRRVVIAAVVIAAVVAAAGCAPPVREAARPAGPPPDFPEAHYRDLLAAGRPVYRVDPKESVVVIEVRRAGKFANLGHDHVVASRDVRGWIAPEEGRADLYVALDALTVDEPGLREESGFDTQPSETDIAGTRANMRDKVLELDKFPYALVHAAVKDGDRALRVAITLHGTTRSFDVPAKVDAEAQRVEASGRLSFDQSAFGIAPYSVLGGAVAVRDRLDLRFDVRARRAGAD